MKSNHVRIETTVLGGFPVIAEGDVQPADNSVGISRAFLDECSMWISTTKGKHAPFIEKKMSKDDWIRLEEQLLSAYHKDLRDE